MLLPNVSSCVRQKTSLIHHEAATDCVTMRCCAFICGDQRIHLNDFRDPVTFSSGDNEVDICDLNVFGWIAFKFASDIWVATGLITSAKKVMFSPLSICWLVGSSAGLQGKKLLSSFTRPWKEGRRKKPFHLDTDLEERADSGILSLCLSPPLVRRECVDIINEGIMHGSLSVCAWLNSRGMLDLGGSMRSTEWHASCNSSQHGAPPTGEIFPSSSANKHFVHG